jgi:hypothetical protein
MSEPPKNESLIDFLLRGLLDSGSGLSEDVLVRLDRQTRGIADRAIERPLDEAEEKTAIAGIVDDAVRPWLADVVEACNGDSELVARVKSAEPVEYAESADLASRRLLRIHGEVSTEIEKTACHHAAAAAELLRAAEEDRKPDATYSAALNAGRVLGELVVAGREDLALQHLRSVALRILT